MKTAMQAIVATAYGSPDVLQLQTVAKPTPKENEVLIKIKATTATAAQGMMREGKPLYGRLFLGLTKPKVTIPGADLAGEVVATGNAVTRFKVGDQLFGATDLGGGAYAEYIALPEDEVLTVKPDNVSHAQATAIMDGGLTSLHFLRDKGKLQPGQSVLIIGASGSVGTAAVQLAKHFGATVTGVCSTTNVELVKSIGADEVIDYTQEDFTRNGRHYDVIFDTVAKSSFAHSKGSLTPQGIYLTTVMGLRVIMQSLLTANGRGKRAVFAAAGLRPAAQKMADLLIVRDLMARGELRAVIDRSYPLAQVAEAQRYVDKGHKKGNVVITVAQEAAQDNVTVQQTRATVAQPA